MNSPEYSQYATVRPGASTTLPIGADTKKPIALILQPSRLDSTEMINLAFILIDHPSTEQVAPVLAQWKAGCRVDTLPHRIFSEMPHELRLLHVPFAEALGSFHRAHASQHNGTVISPP